MIMKKMICSVVLTALMTALLMVVLLPVCGVHAEGKPLTMTYVGPATLSAGQSGDVLKTVINSTESGTVTYTDKDVKKGKTYYYSVSADRDFTYFGSPDNLLFAIDKNATKVKVTKKVKA